MGIFIDRTGETKRMNNGLMATITAYRGNRDIDIQFENGETKQNMHYVNFCKGGICCSKDSRVGEARIMNNGLEATIVAYRNALDMDVKFANGQIAYNRRYGNFELGKVTCPMIVERVENYMRVINPNVQPNSVFTVDEEDLHTALKYSWVYSGNGYLHSGSPQKTLHRTILNTGEGEYIDHINGDKTDNRRCNLRICSKAENTQNQKIRIDNSSGYKGVSLDKRHNKWSVYISSNGKRRFIGYYDTPEAAAQAYNKAAIKHHGEFAKLNEI